MSAWRECMLGNVSEWIAKGTTPTTLDLDFAGEDIAKLGETDHRCRNKTGSHKDVRGFSKSVSLDEIREKDYVLTPGRYIGLPEDEGDFDFAERFAKLKVELDEQMREEARLNELIVMNLAKIQVNDE